MEALSSTNTPFTFLSLGRSGSAHRQVGLFEGPPFEILLVTSTRDLSSFTLVAGRLGFVAL